MDTEAKPTVTDTVLEVQDGVIDSNTIFNRVDNQIKELIDNGEIHS